MKFERSRYLRLRLPRVLARLIPGFRAMEAWSAEKSAPFALAERRRYIVDISLRVDDDQAPVQVFSACEVR